MDPCSSRISRLFSFRGGVGRRGAHNLIHHRWQSHACTHSSHLLQHAPSRCCRDASSRRHSLVTVDVVDVMPVRGECGCETGPSGTNVALGDWDPITLSLSCFSPLFLLQFISHSHLFFEASASLLAEAHRPLGHPSLSHIAQRAHLLPRRSAWCAGAIDHLIQHVRATASVRLSPGAAVYAQTHLPVLLPPSNHPAHSRTAQFAWRDRRACHAPSCLDIPSARSVARTKHDRRPARSLHFPQAQSPLSTPRHRRRRRDGRWPCIAAP